MWQPCYIIYLTVFRLLKFSSKVFDKKFLLQIHCPKTNDRKLDRICRSKKNQEYHRYSFSRLHFYITFLETHQKFNVFIFHSRNYMIDKQIDTEKDTTNLPWQFATHFPSLVSLVHSLLVPSKQFSGGSKRAHFSQLQWSSQKHVLGQPGLLQPRVPFGQPSSGREIRPGLSNQN